MKLRVLVDNTTIIDQYYLAEPAAAYLIEAEGLKVLFDTGYSDVLVRNAAAMGVDLQDLDYIVFSHGHNDHTKGLESLMRHYDNMGCQKHGRPILVAHPDVLLPKQYDGEEIGMRLSKAMLEANFRLELSKGPAWLSPKLVFLGEIVRSNNYENQKPIGTTYREGKWESDLLIDDSAMAYVTDQGIVVITGCSHSGICNILEHAKQVTGIQKIRDVIGGFHLLKPSEEVMLHTIDYMRDQDIGEIHPCHCTDFQSKVKLMEAVPVRELGVGSQLEFD